MNLHTFTDRQMNLHTFTDRQLQDRRDKLNTALDQCPAQFIERRLRSERLEIDDEIVRRWEQFCRDKSDPYDEAHGDDR